MEQVNVQPHIGKSRAPDDIQARVSHYYGEAEGTRINTSNWGQLRTWYLNNRHRPMMRVVAVCEEEESVQ